MRNLAARNLRNFWAAETISAIGGQVSMIAFPLIAITTLQSSAWQLGVLNAIQFTPLILFTVVAGALVDVWPLRGTLAWANALSGLLLLMIPALYGLGALSFWPLCAIALALGTLRVYLDVGIQSYPPMLLPRDVLVTANARLNISYAAVNIGGAAAAGLLLQVVRAPLAVAADGWCFLVAASLVWNTKPQHPVRAEERDRRPLAGILSGARLVFHDAYLRAMAMTSSWFNLCERIVLTAFFVYGVRELALGSAALGACFAAGGVGGVIGAWLAVGLGRRWGERHTMGLGISVAAFGLLMVPWGLGTAGAAIAGAGFFLHLLGLGLYNVFAVSLRQMTAPPQYLGRINACYRLVSHGSVPLGALLSGGLMEWVGARATIVLAGVAATAGALAFCSSKAVRRSDACPFDVSPASPA